MSCVAVTPYTRCRLKLLKLERIKDYLLLEEEFIKNQERLKPQEEKHEVSSFFILKSFLKLQLLTIVTVGTK
jgi:hypothetical protein